MLPLFLPSVVFGVELCFLVLSLNRAPHIIIKRIAIWGVKRPDVRSHVITEIFSQQRLNWLFSYLVWEIVNVLLHYLLIRNSGIPMFLALDLIDLLGSLSIRVWIWCRNLESLFLSEGSEWDFRAAVLSKSPVESSISFRIFYFVSRLISKHGEILWIHSFIDR